MKNSHKLFEKVVKIKNPKTFGIWIRVLAPGNYFTLLQDELSAEVPIHSL